MVYARCTCACDSSQVLHRRYAGVVRVASLGKPGAIGATLRSDRSASLSASAPSPSPLPRPSCHAAWAWGSGGTSSTSALTPGRAADLSGRLCARCCHGNRLLRLCCCAPRAAVLGGLILCSLGERSERCHRTGLCLFALGDWYDNKQTTHFLQEVITQLSEHSIPLENARPSPSALQVRADHIWSLESL